jgi:serine/threonine protein kinase
VPKLPADRWQRLSEYLDTALELSESERESWLSELAARDPDTAALVVQILATRRDQKFPSFLEDAISVSTSTLSSATLIGRAVGSYIIEAEIGYGGMGTVWRARRADGRFEGTVAIKFVHARFVGGAGEQRFRIEGELLARLDHPNIARLIDAGVMEGMQPYLVLEYVKGDPIDTYCEAQRLPLQGRIQLFMDVLGAVSHAHSHLVVHRDIKPANILVTGEGVVKLLDFGIAKLMQGDSDALSLTRSGVSPLTPQYAAPEQLLGQDVTTATDVYALGLVLYLLLTGTHPFKLDARSSSALLHSAITEDPPLASGATTIPAAQRRALVGDLDNILRKALKKTPLERYQSVGVFADDLRRFLNHEPVSARPDSPAYRIGKFVRRHRGAVAGAAVILISLIGTAAFSLRQAQRADQERDAAVLAAQRADSVGDFMSTLLSDIGKSGSPEAQREHLDRARVLLQQQHYDSIVSANLLHYLAARYQEFGYAAPAIELLQEARSALGSAEDRISIAQIGCQLASLYDGLGRADDADREIRASMRVMEDPSSGVRVQVLADCRNEESYIRTARHENALAIAAAQKSVTELEAAGLKSGLEHVTALNALARAHAYAGHYSIAVAVMRQIRSGEADGGSPQTIGAFIHEFNLERYLLAGGRVLEAEKLSGELAAAAPGSANARDLVLLRAKALLALNRSTDAAELLLKSPNGGARERVLTRTELLLRRGDSAGAHLAWSQQQAAIEALLTAQGESAIDALRVKALLALSDGKREDAEEALKRATALAVDVDGRSTPGLRQIAVLRAQEALKSGSADEACENARIALERALAEATDADSSAWIGEGLLLRARCEQARGQLESMRSSARAALPHLEQNLGAEHPLAVSARTLMGTAASSGS